MYLHVLSNGMLYYDHIFISIHMPENEHAFINTKKLVLNNLIYM
jgi:hypothetical protein